MNNMKKVIMKLVLTIIYIFIIVILGYSSFKLFTESRKTVEWKDVEKTNQYTCLTFDQMSEAFAKMGDKQIHFVREKESSGVWHTYLIAIKTSEYEKYKPNIDYTYKRTETVPNSITVYGYPVEISNEIKELAIKNITKFVPIENKIKIDNNNFDQYLTNTYLDTTMEKQEELNYYVIALLLIALVIFMVLIYTIFEKSEDKRVIKDKRVNNSSNDDVEII